MNNLSTSNWFKVNSTNRNHWWTYVWAPPGILLRRRHRRKRGARRSKKKTEKQKNSFSWKTVKSPTHSTQVFRSRTLQKKVENCGFWFSKLFHFLFVCLHQPYLHFGSFLFSTSSVNSSFLFVFFLFSGQR